MDYGLIAIISMAVATGAVLFYMIEKLSEE